MNFAVFNGSVETGEEGARLEDKVFGFSSVIADEKWVSKRKWYSANSFAVDVYLGFCYSWLRFCQVEVYVFFNSPGIKAEKQMRKR